MNCSSSGGELAGGKKGFDAVAAQTGWWMLEIKSTKRKSTKEVTKKKMKGVLDDDNRNESITSKLFWRSLGAGKGEEKS